MKMFFLVPNFAMYLQNMPYPQKKVIIKIEERENPCKMMYVSHMFFKYYRSKSAVKTLA